MPARSRAISPAPTCATRSSRSRPPMSRCRTTPACCMSRPRSARRRSAFSARPARGTGRRSIRSRRRCRPTSKLDCQPCHKPTCRMRHHRCMRDISAEQVLEVTQRTLAEAQDRLRRNPLHGRAHIRDRRHFAERADDLDLSRAERTMLARARCRRRSRPAARRARRRDAAGRYRRRPRTRRARSSARPDRAAADPAPSHSARPRRSRAAPPLGLGAPWQHRRVAARRERLRKLDPVRHRPFLFRPRGRVQQHDLARAARRSSAPRDRARNRAAHRAHSRAPAR